MAENERDTEAETRDRSPFRWVFWLPVALVLYLLSIGPAVAIFGERPPKPVVTALTIFYKPLLLLHKTPLESALIWWTDLWSKLRKTNPSPGLNPTNTPPLLNPTNS